ncbi:class I SAM-dependent methyltransferase [Breznakibacter xylanolyticus]|nr:class I SAM-dependent methyltransferase [Breznakibacter xylanolyticus]
MGDLHNALHGVVCPLCQYAGDAVRVSGPDTRHYYECSRCRLIFVLPGEYPDADREKQRYLAHQNTETNRGYVQFLEQAIDPALPFLRAGDHGLDYGCGPHPTLSGLMGERGWMCDNYDPFFYPELPAVSYDYIFATECIEHFFFPHRDFGQMLQWLKPGGILTLLTGMWQSHAQFATWSYARDFTHVCFYHPQTMRHLAESLHLTMLYNDERRVCVLKKKV